MSEQVTAQKIVELINSMSNEERWKLLEILHDKYFNKDGYPEEEVVEEDKYNE